MRKEQKLSIDKEVSSQESGIRLDRCLRLWISNLPQSLIEKAVRKGLVRLNSHKIKPSHPVEEGQIITFPSFFLSLEPREAPPCPLSLTRKERTWLKSLILYQNDDLIVLNKPPGIAVQKGTNIRKSLDSMMQAYAPSETPRLVHRLDRDTSGLLVFARTLPMARWLTKAFKERQVEKTYWALVAGRPHEDHGTISLPLSKTPMGEKVRVDTDKGLPATTAYRLIKPIGPHISWLELTPTTGRTHQLRVHCSEGLKTPIVGDRKYGAKETGGYLYLHARSLSLPLPGGKALRFEAPLPKRFQEYADKFFPE